MTQSNFVLCLVVMTFSTDDFDAKHLQLFEIAFTMLTRNDPNGQVSWSSMITIIFILWSWIPRDSGVDNTPQLNFRFKGKKNLPDIQHAEQQRLLIVFCRRISWLSSPGMGFRSTLFPWITLGWFIGTKMGRGPWPAKVQASKTLACKSSDI